MPLIRSCSALLLLMALGLLPGCLSHEPRQLIPDITLSPEQGRQGRDSGEARVKGVALGMEASAEEDDALGKLAELPGVRIGAIAPGGPADMAGILPGDVVLSLDGEAVNNPDTLDAIALEIERERQLTVEVRRDTTVFTTVLSVSPADAARRTPVELYRADPVALRAGFTTERLRDTDGDPVAGARIVRLFPESPLPAAGLDIDDVILSVDGQMVESAQGLVTLIHDRHQPGDRVTIGYARDDRLMSERLRLWHPGRRVSRFTLWPLFVFESSLDPDRTELRVGDLWLFSLFSYRRDEGEREYSVLGLFRTATGYGELVEE